MSILGCKCLNILIETEVCNSPFVQKDQLNLTIEEREDLFFRNGNLRRLDKLAIINKSLTDLVEIREVGSWIIHYCINCKTHTHAVHKEMGASCVFVSSNLLTSDAVKKLKNSEDFSRAYAVLIDTSQYDDTDEDIFYPDEVEPFAMALKQALADTVRKEASLVEEKIRIFTEEQYSMLDNLRERLHNEEKRLIRNLVSHISKDPKKERKEMTRLPEAERQPDLQSKANIVYTSSQPTPSNPTVTPTRLKNSPVHHNHDFLFEFDGIDENPQEREDDIESDDLDDMQNKASDRYQSRDDCAKVNIAKSLPMDIPVFMRGRSNEEGECGDNIEQTAEKTNVDIAASIKKLAKSVHGGGIFGDLPRPRFSTQL